MGVDRLIHPASTFRVGFAAQGRGFGFTFPFSNATSKEAVEADLRALEAQGLPVEDLAKAVMDGFHLLFPYSLRLGAGIHFVSRLMPSLLGWCPEPHLPTGCQIEFDSCSRSSPSLSNPSG